MILFTVFLVQIAKAQTVYYWADGKKNELETDNSQFIVRFTAPKVISELGKNTLLQNNKNISGIEEISIGGFQTLLVKSESITMNSFAENLSAIDYILPV